MSITRRSMLAALGGAIATPAWAQAIGSQSDPWAQVDPYADPRNGFPSQGRTEGGQGGPAPRPPGSANRAVQALSQDEQDEIAAGRMAYPYRIKKAGGVYANPKVQQALRDFCKPMFAISDRSHLPWVVTLVNQVEPNASAGPGGTVIVHAGILALFDNPYDFASILAHEVGHVDCRHLSQGMDLALLAKMARERGITGMGDQAMATLMPELDGQVPDFMALMANSFSREDEAEADAHGVEIFERLGVDPAYAAGGMRAILKLEQMFGGGAPNEWVTDHPLTPDRISHIEQVAALRRKPRTNFVFPGWDVLKAALPTDPRFKKA